ncbi:MAG: hypothetical protein M4D80_34240 [Myxococcota bacterium]|nr:hypothetical protein [Deltaproteobacteria bacterium]MDQ3340246.1 hypothetical protein [Myxococcota bacterium]
MCACASAPPKRVEPQCSADANIVLAGQEDVFAAAGCLTIQSLTIRTGVPLDLSALGKLQIIRGDLRVGPTVGVDNLALPELQSAGAITIASNHDLHGATFAKLVSARSVTVEGNPAMTTLVMPALGKVGETLTVRANGDLEIVELSSLVTVGGPLVIADHPDLTLLELGKLERAGSVTLENTGAVDANIVDAVRSKAAN